MNKELYLDTELLMAASHAEFYYSLDDEAKNGWNAPSFTLDFARQYIFASKDLSKIVDKFENEVWFPVLQKQVNDGKMHGMSAEVEGIKILIYAIAGRCMITFRKDDKDVTFITAEDEKQNQREDAYTREGKTGPMGWQSIHANLGFVDEAVSALILNKDKIKLKDDEEVFFG